MNVSKLHNLFFYLTLVFVFTSNIMLNASASNNATYNIGIGNINCKGTMINIESGYLVPPKLAIVTAAHCLKEYATTTYTRTILIKSNTTPQKIEYREIDHVVYGSDDFQKKMLPELTKIKTNLDSAMWCKKYHQEDIAIIFIKAHYYDKLTNSVYNLNSLSSQINHEGNIYFKNQYIDGKDYKNNNFRTLFSAEISISAGDSGNPIFSGEKIVGVASCYVANKPKTRKTNYFAAWSQKLQAAIKIK